MRVLQTICAWSCIPDIDIIIKWITHKRPQALPSVFTNHSLWQGYQSWGLPCHYFITWPWSFPLLPLQWNELPTQIRTPDLLIKGKTCLFKRYFKPPFVSWMGHDWVISSSSTCLQVLSKRKEAVFFYTTYTLWWHMNISIQNTVRALWCWPLQCLKVFEMFVIQERNVFYPCSFPPKMYI